MKNLTDSNFNYEGKKEAKAPMGKMPNVAKQPVDHKAIKAVTKPGEYHTNGMPKIG